MSDRFQFESGTVPLLDGRLFTPTRDAVQRWIVRSPGYYRALGEDFEILYELHGAKFVFVVYTCCTMNGLPSYVARRASGGLWTGTVAVARQATPSEALDWLLEHNFQPPASLAHLTAGRGIVDPADRPAVDESALVWVWPLFPLASDAGSNLKIPADSEALGQPVDVGRRRYYVPTAADVAVIAKQLTDTDPTNPSWPRIEARLIAAGRKRETLLILNAPTLVGLLAESGGARGGGRKPDTDEKADARLAEAWATGQYPTIAELAQAFGVRERDAQRGLDRHRKRGTRRVK